MQVVLFRIHAKIFDKFSLKISKSTLTDILYQIHRSKIKKKILCQSLLKLSFTQNILSQFKELNFFLRKKKLNL